MVLLKQERSMSRARKIHLTLCAGARSRRVLITGASAGIVPTGARSRSTSWLTWSRRREMLLQLAGELWRGTTSRKLIVPDLAKPPGPAAVVKAAQPRASNRHPLNYAG